MIENDKISFPNIDFLILIDDELCLPRSIDHDSTIELLKKVPVFAMSKNVNHAFEKDFLLLPDLYTVSPHKLYNHYRDFYNDCVSGREFEEDEL